MPRCADGPVGWSAGVRRRLRGKAAPTPGAQRQTAPAPTTPKPVKIGPVTTELTPRLEQVIAGVREENLTYLGVGGLRTLASVVTDLETAGIPGLILEAGVARGGSAIVLATAKSPTRATQAVRRLQHDPAAGEKDGADVHDRYQTIVSGQAEGVGGETYYGYRDDLLTEVTESFARHGVPVGREQRRAGSGPVRGHARTSTARSRSPTSTVTGTPRR